MLRPETVTARKLRRSMSLPEVLLWRELRRQRGDVRFRRQHPIGAYVVDFYCSRARLIVEVDGEARNCGDRPVRDAQRDSFLRENDYRVLHVAAKRALADPVAAAEAIFARAAIPLHHASHGPPPRAGEDQE